MKQLSAPMGTMLENCRVVSWNGGRGTTKQLVSCFQRANPLVGAGTTPETEAGHANRPGRWPGLLGLGARGLGGLL